MSSISLAKKQSISLSKQSSSNLTKLEFGLGWDAAKKSGFLGGLFGGSDSIDLDASVVLLDDKAKQIDMVWFRQLSSKCRSVRHSGDDRTGEGDGDDEVIKIDLTCLPSNVEHLAFTVNSFTGQTFDAVDNAYCRVSDQSGKELAKFKLNDQGKHTGVLISSLKRAGGQWEFTAHGVPCNGRTITDMMEQIVEELF